MRIRNIMAGKTVGAVLLLTAFLCWGCRENKPQATESGQEATKKIELEDAQPLVYSTIHEAARKGDLADVKRHLAKGADVNVRDNMGQTPLYGAGNKDVAELLIAKGADVNAKSAVLAKGLFTPLHFAALAGHKDVAELLISKGADMNVKIADGNTPLHCAAMMGKGDVAELLLAKGVQVNAKNNAGYTPLQAAVKVGHKEVVELLRKHGALE